VHYEWDENKREANLLKHGVDFNIVHEFAWENAAVMVDARTDYREQRYTAMGFIGSRLHLLVFTLRGEAVRVIGLRKANKRERGHYESKT
jgi:hypothetical protein